MTLAEFGALLARREKEREHALYCAGTVAAAIYNVHRGEGAELLSGADFIPRLREQQAEEDEPAEEEKLAQFKAFFEGLKKPTSEGVIRR